MASMQGNVEAMRKLIAKGADINAFATYDDLGSILNTAISSGNLEAVELLIDEGAELSFPEEKRSDDIPPPLGEAARTSNAIFDLLLSKGAGNLSAYDYDEAFIIAAANGQTEILEKLLKYDHPQEICQHAMKRAVEESEWEIVKIMLEKLTGLDCHEAFVQAAISVDDHTDILYEVWKHTKHALPKEIIDEALYRATDWEKLDIVRVLLNDFGADPNAEAPMTPPNEGEDTNQQENNEENGDDGVEHEDNVDVNEAEVGDDDDGEDGEDGVDQNDDDGGDDQHEGAEDGDDGDANKEDDDDDIDER